jgi:hypothetical protein
MTAPQTRYRFAPRDRTGWLLGLSGTQCLLLAGGLALAGVALPTSPLAALLVVCTAALAAFASWNQQPAASEAVLRIHWGTRHLRKQTVWTSPQPFVRSTAPQLPKRFGRLRFWGAASPAWPNHPITVVEDQAEQTYTVLLPAATRGFALLEPGDQERLLAGWGELLGGFTSARHPVVRLTVSEWAGRSDTTTLADALIAPDGDPTATEVYRDLLAAAGPASSRHETLLALTVRPERTQRRSAGPAGVTVALEQARLLTARLDGIGIDTDAPLAPADVARLLRSRTGGQPPASAAPALPASAPMSMRTSWDHVQLDAACHAVYWIAEWPRLPVTPTWLEPLLLHPGGTRTLTLHIEPVSARDAARQVRRDATRLVADQHQRERSGWRVDATHERTRTEVEQREHELAAGYAELNYLGLLTITAPTTSALEAACREFEDIASQVGVELRRLNGQHDLALPSSLGFLGRPVPNRRLR